MSTTEAQGIREMASEPRRVAALREVGILDTPREELFDRFVRAASALFGVPMAAVNFIDTDRQWTKAEVGLGASRRSTCPSRCACTPSRGTQPSW